MRVLGRCVAVLCLLGLSAAAGCSPGRGGAADPEATVAITAHAVLDEATATISLPLDSYGMSPREAQFARAAASIVLARCATGQQDVSASGLQSVRQYLASPAVPMPEWLFGFWDAEYIAAKGRQPHATVPPALAKPDPATGRRCVQEPDYVAVTPITTFNLSNDKYAALVEYSNQAWDRTAQDPRFVRLRSDFSKCIQGHGFTMNSEKGVAAINFGQSWSAEQQLKAALAVATCNDGLRLTQQAGDIEASYQQEYIKADEAEFTTIKKEADRRVSKAQEVLRGVGLL